MRLSPSGDDATILELEHTAIVPEDRWDRVRARRRRRRLGAGPARAGAPPARRLRRRSDRLAAVRRGPGVRDPEQRGWGAANVAAGADPAAAARAVANTTAFYAPDPGAAS